VISGTPSLSQFDPAAIPWQLDLIKDVRKKFDYSGGFHDVLLSGTVGSAKSMVGAHLALTHCLLYPGARLCLARRSMPDLKDTIFSKVLEHIGDDLREGRDYWVNANRGQIAFRNKSKIISRSWGDRKAKKARSLDLSALLIEELTENEDEEDRMAIEELKMRLGRVASVKENWCIAMTNPDSPAHWAYKYYFESQDPNRHVLLSTLDQNPFLPSWYKESLLRNLDPKTADRMVYGKWIEIKGEVVYHCYDRAVNFRKSKYTVDLRYPIRIGWDFNIGEGKPLSLILFQYIDGAFHWFDEVVVHSAITEEACAELAARGLLDYDTLYIIHGDATGKARSTQAKHSNYEIIRQFLNQHVVSRPGQVPRRLRHEQQVLVSNPPIRERHRQVNAYFKNALGEVRSFVYQDCKTADEGFRLTKLKKGGQYVEDDSQSYQHITTAAGYGLLTTLLISQSKPQGTEEL
jgi:hypothetical protein